MLGNPAERGLSVVGIGLRLPGATDLDQLAALCAQGAVSLRSEPPPVNLGAGPVLVARVPDPVFAPSLAHLAPGLHEARMDTASLRQRLTLAAAMDAVADAGAGVLENLSRVGVVVAGSGPAPSAAGSLAAVHEASLVARLRESAKHRGLLEAVDEVLAAVPRAPAPDHQALPREEPSLAAGRVALALDLQGPAVTIDAFTAGGLAAVGVAADCLAAGRADGMLVIAAEAGTGADALARFQALGLLSETACLPFDAGADGTALGEGAVALLLVPAARAAADGLPGHGVVRALAWRSDGAAGRLVRPTEAGQRACYEEALARAGIAALDVGYVEAHGTGTPVGDAAEVRSLAGIYGADRDPATPLLLGSAKGSFGHLRAAAGAVGLVRGLLALRAGVAPPQPGFCHPNEALRSYESLMVSDQLQPFDAPCVGVSAFSLAGVSLHAILEGPGEPSRSPVPLEAPAASKDAGEKKREARTAEVVGRIQPPVSEESSTDAFMALVAGLAGRLPEEVSPTARFIEDLGLESLDLMELRAAAIRDLGLPESFPVTQLSSMEALLAALPGETASPAAGAAPAPQGPGSRPASMGQEALWYLDRLGTTGSAYHLPFALRMKGELDLAALQGALDQVVARHEPLRTTFPGDGGRCSPLVGPARPVPLVIHDPVDDADSIRRRVARAPFSLETDPVLRAELLRHDEADHELLLTIHHIAFDGLSHGVLKQELTEGYAARVEGRSPELPDLVADYSSVEAARRHRAEAARSATLDAWRRDLDGAIDPLVFPLALRRVTQMSHASGLLRRPLDRGLISALENRARSDGVTLAAELLAACQVLLGRWSGQESFLIGVPIAGRGSAEAAPLIGHFANTLPIPARLGETPGFRDVAARAHAGLLAALDRQDLPLAEVVAALDVERGLSRPALFHTFFQVLMGFGDPPELAGLETSWTCLDSGGAIVDLALHVQLDRAGAEVQLNYATDIFDEDVAEELLEQYVHVLEHVASHADPAWRRIPLLDDAGRERALAAGRGKRTPYPRDQTLADLVAAQAAARPDAPALSDGTTTRTYAQLWEAARRVAAALGTHGVEPGAVVGLVADRVLPTFEAMLGIVVAGAAYLPIDPSEPSARREEMFAGAGVSHVVGAAARASMGAGRRFLSLEDAATACPVVGPRPHPDGLAYVIFTSGTTGVPKGVVVPQRAIVRLVHDADFVRLASDSVMAQMESLCFDNSTGTIWGAFLKGGRLEIIDRETQLSPRLLGEAFRARGITVAGPPAAMFSALARADPGIFSCLESLVIGGEAVRCEDVEAVRRAGYCGYFAQDYGPTEATCSAAYHAIDGIPDPRRRLPIGRPIANTDLHVLDEALDLVAPGCVGELYVGGDALALGYLDPVRTAASFLVDPHADGNGSRLYRTGDLAVRRPDGAHVLLGRRDRQVKLRGHRIELAEVEATAAAAPGVGACAAALREVTGAPTLILWVVPEPDTPWAPEALDRFLADRLPRFMRPSHLLVVDQLPQTRQGKLDVAALPSPEPEGPGEWSTSQPEGAEWVIGRVWREVLGGEPPAPDADFFRSGGNSLKIIELLARVDRTLGVLVPVPDFLRDPTVRGLAARVREPGADQVLQALGGLDADAETAEISALTRVVETWPGSRAHPGGLVVGRNVTGPRRPLFWCLQGEWEHEQLARALGKNQPLHAMRSGHLVLDHPPEMVPAMARRYATEICAVDPDGPYFLGGNCQGGTIAFQTALELSRRGRKVELLFLLDILVEAPFPGEVALLYGQRSEENPFRNGPGPVNSFRRLYRSHTLDFLDAGHGEYFGAPVVDDLATTLRRRMEDAETRLGASAAPSVPSPRA
jgi:amino acid adenylation domain-containing protein